MLKSFVDKTKNSNIEIGAQDCHIKSDYGPYTGAISSKMIKDLGYDPDLANYKNSDFNNEETEKIKIENIVYEVPYYLISEEVPKNISYSLTAARFLT